MLTTLMIIILCLVIIAYGLRFVIKKRRRKHSIAFFHLYCLSGGGGERVLWHTIEALFKEFPKHTVYIYCHRSVKPRDKLEILDKVQNLFKIDLLSEENALNRLVFVPLITSPLVEARQYQALTLLGQSLGSIVVALEAAYRITPELYIETIGFSFTLPVFKLLSCKVATYVHYPTISSDMIDNVKTSKHASFNNREIFIRHPILRQVKLLYYKTLASLYGFAGRRADLVLVNSSWTQAHINSLWGVSAKVVYPPCDIENFKRTSAIDVEQDECALNILSIAQFRPEKNHQLQIEAFDAFLRETGAYNSKLSLYGGCRDDEDRHRVRQLEELVQTLDLGPNVDIIVGAPFESLLKGMRQAQVAIHTMENEHFGIVLVECMAAGLITIAHNSGGPRADIIDDKVSGFLASNAQEFTDRLVQVSKMSAKERQVLRNNAVDKAGQFCAQNFATKFVHLVRELNLTT